jgi:hypothetical protein
MNTFEQLVVAVFALVITLSLAVTAFSTFRLYQMAENERQVACKAIEPSGSWPPPSWAYKTMCE